ncbi:hypothetical protein [Fischerella thermalis]|uniref:hypothetical protein n=1 Tax=Fischerella thermalis TaxID=372787 RepID=UPI0015E0F6FF|nr:hypothetical protein [Fischerella thermalis]
MGRHGGQGGTRGPLWGLGGEGGHGGQGRQGRQGRRLTTNQCTRRAMARLYNNQQPTTNYSRK